jgi:hypothetical protein
MPNRIISYTVRKCNRTWNRSANGDRLQGDWHAVRGSESRAAVMESSPALPFPQSRGKSVDKVGGGVYNVSSYAI